MTSYRLLVAEKNIQYEQHIQESGGDNNSIMALSKFKNRTFHNETFTVRELKSR